MSPLGATGWRPKLFGFLTIVSRCQAKWDHIEQEGNIELYQATSSCYSMLRGFMNTLAAQDTNCAMKFLCEGAQEAATAGPLGEVIAEVASTNAGSWLSRVNSTVFAGVGGAGLAGAARKDCDLRYSECFELPLTYRYPSVFRETLNAPQSYQTILMEILNDVKDSLLLHSQLV
ncbi:uncharacterized protein LOC143037305 [Oratosquilla oratoria]|uniref:uncharacterized protein LOC143037305 n=1 Tax=Oratosquilla oratoria TaxID=337810 RepID=UPI003F760ECD